MRIYKGRDFKEQANLRYDLVPGNTYMIRSSDYGSKGECSIENRKVPVEMELVKLFPYFALFQRSSGIRECFGYWELNNVRLVR